MRIFPSNIKKGLALSSIPVFLILSSCSGGSAGSDGAEEITLTYWNHTFEPLNDTTKDMIEEFEEEHPNITIDYSVIPNDQFFTKMLTSVGSGSGPDVFNMSSTYIQSYLDSGNVAPIDPEAFGFEDQSELEDNWQPESFSLVQDDEDTIYGVPNEYNVSALAINTADFEKAGLDPNEPPETWEEVEEYSKALTETDSSGDITKRGFDFYYVPNFYWLDFANLSMQHGGHLLSEDGESSLIDSPENAKAMQWWQDWVGEKQLGGPKYSLRDESNTVSDFTTNSVSMFIVYPWAQSAIEESDVWEDTEIVPLPQVDPDNPVTHMYGYYWMVNESSEHQEAAWEFIDYMSSQPERFLDEVGYIQPKKGWTDSEATQDFPFIDVWLDAQEYADAGEASAKLPEIRDILQNMVESIISEGVPVETALQEADSAISDAIGE